MTIKRIKHLHVPQVGWKVSALYSCDCLEDFLTQVRFGRKDLNNAISIKLDDNISCRIKKTNTGVYSVGYKTGPLLDRKQDIHLIYHEKPYVMVPLIFLLELAPVLLNLKPEGIYQVAVLSSDFTEHGRGMIFRPNVQPYSIQSSWIRDPKIVVSVVSVERSGIEKLIGNNHDADGILSLDTMIESCHHANVLDDQESYALLKIIGRARELINKTHPPLIENQIDLLELYMCQFNWIDVMRSPDLLVSDYVNFLQIKEEEHKAKLKTKAGKDAVHERFQGYQFCTNDDAFNNIMDVSSTLYSASRIVTKAVDKIRVNKLTAHGGHEGLVFCKSWQFGNTRMLKCTSPSFQHRNKEKWQR